MEIFKLFGSIFVDTEAADKSMKKTEKNADSIATKLGNGIKTAAKWGAGLVTAATGAAAAVGGAMVSIAESTREYRNEMGKLETAYESAGFSAEDAKDTYEELNAVLGDTGQSVEAANHLAMLCDTQEDLSIWTDICTGVYAKFGASLPIEGLTEAANETAKTGALTGGLADALNWAGVNEDAFQEKLDACATEQERQALITETLNDLYAESAELYRENNKAVLDANAAQDKWNSAMAKVGTVVEPVITTVKLFGASLLEKVIPSVSTFIGWIGDKVPKAGERFNGMVRELGTKVKEFAEKYIIPLYERYLPNLQTMFETLVTLWKTVIFPILQLVIDTFLRMVSSIYKNVVPAIQSMMDKYRELSTLIQQVVNEYIIPVIQAFVEMIQELYEENKEKLELIGELFGSIFSWISEKLSVFIRNFKDKILPFIELICNYVKENMDKIKNIFQTGIDLITGILQIFIALFKGDWSTLWEAVKFTTKSGVDFINGIFEFLEGFLREILVKLIENIDEKFEEIYTIMKEKIQAAKDKVVEIFENLKSGVAEKIASMKEVVADTFDNIKSTISSKIKAAKSVVEDVVDSIKDFFDFEVSLPKIKLPHFSIEPEGWKLGDLLEGIIPELAVKWYAKGGIMEKPTVFGVNGNQLMAGGEAGPEAIAPIDVLQGYIAEAVAAQNTAMVVVLQQILEAIIAMDENMGGNLRDALDGTAFELNHREFARLVKAVN